MIETVLDPILYGADPRPNVVAVEPDADKSFVQLYVRTESGGVEIQEAPFVPWLVSQTERYFEGAMTSRLDGEGYIWRIDFAQSGWRGYQEARRALRDDHVGVLSYGSQSKQFLIQSGITLFQGMAFDDLRRMQIDIETTSLSPQEPGARIFLISLCDNSGRCEVLDGDEAEMLETLGARIREWDPDVIEGHNFYGFDLPYILARCAMLGVVPAFGRGEGQSVAVGNERNVAIGTNSRPFTPYYIAGRHVLDTYLQVQRFDWSRGQVSSYGLKECAQVYNIAPKDRVYLDRSDIMAIYQADPEKVKTYARQDVEETRGLAALVAPTEFYQTQMVPDSYQSVAVTGNGEKVNSLLVREYLRQGRAVPTQKPPKDYPGGYTEVRRTGVIAPIVKTDVESLYPSLMLTQKIKPASDTLDIFLTMLSDLTRRRLEAKAESKRAPKDTREHAYWDGLQNSFKTIINSFYGYIGGPFYFNDFDAARAVTEAGQEVVKKIADELEATGSSVVEIDTDGVYFQPPPNIKTEEDEQVYIDKVAQVLPPGIRLAHDGRYKAMLSLKMKNYVLVEESGRRIYKGSSLRSRADEPYGKRFLTTAIDLLLENKRDDVAQFYLTMLAEIQAGNLLITELARRERVTNKMLNSEQRKRTGEAIKAAGITEGDIVHLYQRSDKSMALQADYAHDEDREYYATKLYKFAQRLMEAVGEDEFARIFPKPKSEAKRIQEQLQPMFEF